jgi:hypothetical protein
MTLELSPRVREKLQSLSDETDQNLSEVVRRALAVYDFILTETKKGGELIIRTPDGEKELVLL